MQRKEIKWILNYLKNILSFRRRELILFNKFIKILQVI